MPVKVAFSPLSHRMTIGSSRQAVLDRDASFRLGYYNAWAFQAQTTRGTAQAFLVSSSPNDELLTAADMTAVTSTIRQAITKLRGNKSCQVTPIEADLTPPWNADDDPSLVFGNAWTVFGYNCTMQDSGTRPKPDTPTSPPTYLTPRRQPFPPWPM